jgi:hypothetical protein
MCTNACKSSLPAPRGSSTEPLNLLLSHNHDPRGLWQLRCSFFQCVVRSNVGVGESWTQLDTTSADPPSPRTLRSDPGLRESLNLSGYKQPRRSPGLSLIPTVRRQSVLCVLDRVSNLNFLPCSLPISNYNHRMGQTNHHATPVLVTLIPGDGSGPEVRLGRANSLDRLPTLFFIICRFVR